MIKCLRTDDDGEYTTMSLMHFVNKRKFTYN